MCFYHLLPLFLVLAPCELFAFTCIYHPRLLCCLPCSVVYWAVIPAGASVRLPPSLGWTTKYNQQKGLKTRNSYTAADGACWGVFQQPNLEEPLQKSEPRISSDFRGKQHQTYHKIHGNAVDITISCRKFSTFKQLLAGRVVSTCGFVTCPKCPIELLSRGGSFLPSDDCNLSSSSRIGALAAGLGDGSLQ